MTQDFQEFSVSFNTGQRNQIDLNETLNLNRFPNRICKVDVDDPDGIAVRIDDQKVSTKSTRKKTYFFTIIPGKHIIAELLVPNFSLSMRVTLNI